MWLFAEVDRLDESLKYCTKVGNPNRTVMAVISQSLCGTIKIVNHYSRSQLVHQDPKMKGARTHLSEVIIDASGVGSGLVGVVHDIAAQLPDRSLELVVVVVEIELRELAPDVVKRR